MLVRDALRIKVILVVLSIRKLQKTRIRKKYLTVPAQITHPGLDIQIHLVGLLHLALDLELLRGKCRMNLKLMPLHQN